ncbi:MAG: carboxylating nicotinate-nucleotide diphosphorylase [Bacteriovorax sp.]|jgi:nicotinate-nucleotide pyrophosphorylase (carboxylating)|nr:carboxylating nicotinate-nucleotide diphosphorylase [Bacteriovorax sp.]
MGLLEKGVAHDLARFFEEDDLQGNAFYLAELPESPVLCQLKIKSDILLSGLPYFIGAFNFLGAELSYEDFKQYEGKFFAKGEVIPFSLPFSLAITGERVALNLLQRSCAISTFTSQFIERAKPYGTKILDTRKTTPGLRSLEKYAVRMGGAFNHRFSQADVWMIKDNHKSFFGGLKPALEFFQKMQTHYQNIVVEVHSLTELAQAIDLGVKHVMLDNFSSEEIKKALDQKRPGMTFEISGGINLSNCESFFLDGVDAVSIGALTHSAPHVDLSMKIKRIGV